MLVGEVRWATTGSGTSWKLSGGSMWSAGVTKVSKKRHVCLAIRRRVWASASASGRRAMTRRDWLAQRATAGEANQTTAKATASGQVPRPQTEATAIAATPMTITPAIRW